MLDFITLNGTDKSQERWHLGFVSA